VALLGWAKGNFASKVVIGDGNAELTHEADGGLVESQPTSSDNDLTLPDTESCHSYMDLQNKKIL